MELVSTPAAGVLDAPAAVEPVKKVRKKRASKHDFKDGRGRVFAHRHVNGDGWVADTAKVADSVFVHKKAQVYHNAVIEGAVSIKSTSQVCGNARLSGRVWVDHMAVVGGSAVLSDDCKVWHNSHVYGGHLMGSTVVYDNSHVRQYPRLIDASLRGATTISGYAQVIKSSMTGSVHITGDAHVCSSVLEGWVTVGGKAQIISSKLRLQSCYDSDENAFLTGRNRLKVVDFAIVANVEEISAFLVIKGHSMVVGGRIQFRPNHDGNRYERLETETDALFPGVAIERRDQFMSYNVPASQRGRALNHLMPTTRPVNMDALIPARRLMSMGGAT